MLRQFTRHLGTHARMLDVFSSAERLHFANEQTFVSSDLCQSLDKLLSVDFRIQPNSENVLTTLPMRDVLKKLSLESAYGKFVEDDKWLIGIHGTGYSSLPAIVPQLTNIKAMNSSHNPYHTIGAPVWFFYGSNLRMALHYSSLNAIQSETITGDSNPHYYPQRIGVLGFVDRFVINQLVLDMQAKQHTDSIIAADTYTWLRRNQSCHPDEERIGKEIRLPALYHKHAVHLPIFAIHGAKRRQPLDEGIQYANGQACRWVKGEGYKDLETGETLKLK
jgi:hypothetical protein